MSLAEPRASWVSNIPTSSRFISLVATDKPIYRPGETIRYRLFLLNPFAATLPSSTSNNKCLINVLNSQNASVFTQELTSAESGVYHGTWAIPASQAGGDFTLRFSHTEPNCIGAQRRINIRTFSNPRYKSQIVFSKNGYSAGETVSALLSVERSQGGAPTKATFTYEVLVDGEVAFECSEPQKLDAGKASLQFNLPSTISSGDGTIAITLDDSGEIESISKTIPLSLKAVQLILCPESTGSLVPDVQNTVYFQAKSPISNEPIDVQGSIIDSKTSKVIATFQTEHEGRGKIKVIPEANVNYLVKITSPEGIDNVIVLPFPTSTNALINQLPAAQGYITITSDKTVYDHGDKAAFTVRCKSSTTAASYNLTLCKKETVLSSQNIAMEVNKQEAACTIDLSTLPTADGVLTATLSQGSIPLCEKLLFVKKATRSLNISVQTDYKTYLPGEKISMTITTLDGNNTPVSAIVGVAVTDDTVLQMVEPRLQAPRIRQMYYLEPEVENLEDAQIYLNASNSLANTALELLLGVQGWRRFVYSKPASDVFDGENAIKYGPLLALTKVTLEAVEKKKNHVKFQRRALRRRGVDEDEGEEEEKRVVKKEMKRKKKKMERAASDDEDEEECTRESLSFSSEMEPEMEISPLGTAATTAVQGFPELTPRTNFEDTIYWNPCIKTNEKTGAAVVDFKLSDALTSFRVVADGFSSKAVPDLGSSDSYLIATSRGFYIEAKVPNRLVIGDEASIAVIAVNDTNKVLDADIDCSLAFKKTGFSAVNLMSKSVTIPPQSKAPIYVPLKVTSELYNRGECHFAVRAEADVAKATSKTKPFRDAISKALKLEPNGTPETIFYSGSLETRRLTTFDFNIPEVVLKDVPMELEVSLYPSSTSNITAALESLIQQPSGCFEQTSSTLYPLIMARKYFSTKTDVNPQWVKRSDEYIAKGYQKLVGYECKQGGFEWFGSDPAHEALTAYGVLEFTDMREVYPVDMTMLNRTLDWLLSRSAASGSFARSSQALDDFGGAPEHTTNAYIVYSLTGAGIPESKLKPNIEWIEKHATQFSNDLYFMGLYAGILINIGREEEAKKIAMNIANNQKQTGEVSNAVTSITSSRGCSLIVETTSIALLVWLSFKTNNPFQKNIAEGMNYITSVCKGGKYGSTQGTVLALKALLTYDAKSVSSGKFFVQLDGKKLAERSFEVVGSAAEPVKESYLLSPQESTLPNTVASVLPGEHKVTLTLLSTEQSASSSVNFSMQLKYRSNRTKTESSEPNHLGFTATLLQPTLKEGQVTNIEVVMENLSKEQPKAMTIAVIGIPSGLTVRVEKLQQLVKANTIAAYELFGPNVVLYWRGMAPAEKKKLLLDVTATTRGSFIGDTPSAYLYYYDEVKVWAEPIKVQITSLN